MLHREIPDDRQLQAQWNALVEQAESPEVFYTYQWALAMQRAYGSRLVPFLVLLYDGDNLAGVGSLAVEQAANVASFLAGTTADYCDFLSAREHRAGLVAATLLELAKAGIRKIEFANLPADSPSVRALRSATREHAFRFFLRPAYLCAQVELGDEQARISLKTSIAHKNTFRRAMTKLEKEGVVALNSARTWPEIEAILPGFFTSHVSRFLSTGRISNITSGERRVFLTELARLLSASGCADVSRLTLGSEPVAWNYGFRFAGSWFWYLPTFEPAYEPVSPGYCLLARIVLEACDTPGMQRVDMGLGAEGYKDRFANRTRATLHGTLTNSLCDHAIVFARYEAAHQIARWPRIEALIREIRERVISARESRSGLLSRILARVRRPIWSQDEVIFYRWPSEGGGRLPGGSEEFRLLPLDLNLLATGAMQFSTDKETCSYLLRSAQRLRKSRARGFALVNSSGVPVHVCWSDQFDGFFMAELGIRLKADSSSADMIFDCWTPHEFRGQGFYAKAVARLAQALAREGRDPWIFSAASNVASIRGIDQARFERRYSLVRYRILGWQRISRVETAVPDAKELQIAS